MPGQLIAEMLAGIAIAAVCFWLAGREPKKPDR